MELDILGEPQGDHCVAAELARDGVTVCENILQAVQLVSHFMLTSGGFRTIGAKTPQGQCSAVSQTH